MAILASMTSWLTPTTLFVFLNFVIGTIYLTSRLASPPPSRKSPQSFYSHHPPPPLARAPSLLDRVRSINFSMYNFPEPEPDHPVEVLHRAPSLLERVRSINMSSFYTCSDPEPVPEKMRKSTSERAVAAEEEIEEERRVELTRPKSESMLQKTASFGDEAVDAKADDFINRFKDQLRLQRLESILRSKA